MDRRVAVLGLVVACVLAPRLTPSATDAGFTARTSNPSEASLAALGPPTDLAVAPVGLDVSLAWTAGDGGNASRVEAAANGTSDDCGAALFSTVADTTATTHAEVAPSDAPGTRRCYRVRSTYASWASVEGNPVVVVRLGVVAATVAMANAAATAGCASSGEVGVLDCGDRVTVTFNQPMDSAAGPSGSHTVCADPLAGAVVLGATSASGACSVDEATTVGVLSGGAVGADARHEATFAWSDGGHSLTITVGDRVVGTPASMETGPWTYTPAAGLRSATGGHGVCTSDTGGADCLPEASSGM